MNQDSSNYNHDLSKGEQNKTVIVNGQADTNAWIEDAVLYHIMPDRFASSWKRIQTIHEVNAKEENGAKELYCGTIQGIIDNVDYFLKLGINGIILNPFIFMGRYDEKGEEGQSHIHEKLGTDGEFEFMVGLCHNCNMKVLLEGLEQHCKNMWSYRVNQKEKIEDSKLEYYQLLCNRWINDFKVDGVYVNKEEQNRELRSEFLQAIKDSNQDCLIIGDEWDSNTNTCASNRLDVFKRDAFRNLCKDFFARERMDAYEFERSCTTARNNGDTSSYSKIVYLSDVYSARFFSECKQRAECYMIAVLYVMTSPGIPYILYGDEQQLVESQDGSCLPMHWEEERELFSFFKAAIFVRKQVDALRHGKYKCISAKKGSRILWYERYTETECITIILNAGSLDEKIEVNLEKKMMIWQYGFEESCLLAYGFIILREKF